MRGQEAAHITRRGPQLSLVYSEEYAELPTASPLSLSMPLEESKVDDRRVDSWISGLLPGNPDVRKRWAAKYAAASPQAFDLLGTSVGMDCPGAVQFRANQSPQKN